MNRKTLTPKQSKFLQLLPHAKSVKQAYVDAGYSKVSAESNAHKLLNRPHIREVAKGILKDHGIDDGLIADKVMQGMNAMRREVSKDGSTVELGPDWSTRYKYIELASKMTGALPDPRLELTGEGGGAIVVRVTPGLD
jgi:hypothetical protein